jgi:hypothetical protein
MSQTLNSEYKKKFTRIRWVYETERERLYRELRSEKDDKSKRKGGGTGSPCFLSQIPLFIPASV